MIKEYSSDAQIKSMLSAATKAMMHCLDRVTRGLNVAVVARRRTEVHRRQVLGRSRSHCGFRVIQIDTPSRLLLHMRFGSGPMCCNRCRYIERVPSHSHMVPAMCRPSDA